MKIYFASPFFNDEELRYYRRADISKVIQK